MRNAAPVFSDEAKAERFRNLAPKTWQGPAQGYMPVPHRVKELADFALDVQGNDLAEAGIVDGDLVLVHIQDTAKDGEVVVACAGGKATLMRFHESDRLKILGTVTYKFSRPDGRSRILLFPISTKKEAI